MDLSLPHSPSMGDKELPPALSLPLDLSLPPGPTLDEKELRGREFPSWEEFSTFFDAWCEQRKVLFFVRNATALSKCKRKKVPISPETAAALKYSCVRLTCKEGRQPKKLEQRDDKNVCGTNIAVRLNNRKDRLVVTECHLTHNHALCPVQFKHQFRKGQLLDHKSSQAVRSTSDKMRTTSDKMRTTSDKMRTTSDKMRTTSDKMRTTSDKMRTTSDKMRTTSSKIRTTSVKIRTTSRKVRTASGKIAKQFMGDHDIRRLLASCKGRDSCVQEALKALDGLFAGDPASKVKVLFVKSHAVIQTVFLQTSLMRSLCQRFPETLIFDRMMGFNEEFALFTLLCVDANGRGRECAFCLARKGTPDLLRFTLLSLVQSMPEVWSKVRSLTVGVRVTEPGVVQEFLLNAHVQICRLEVLGTLFNKIQEIGSAQDEKSWPLLCDLASSSSQETYGQTMARMEVSFSRDFMRHFQEHWHQCRKMWVACWQPESLKGISTSMLIRQHQQKLVSGLSPSPTLGQCIVELVAMQAPKVDLESLNVEEVAGCYRSVCNPEPARLIEGEIGVASHGYYSIQATEEGYTIGDGTSKYFLDQKLTSCTCSFHTSTHLPCRHLFVTRFRTGETLFDVNLLQKNKSSLIKTLQQ